MRMAELKVSLAQAVIRNARSSLDHRHGGAAIEHDRHELLDPAVHGSVSIHRRMRGSDHPRQSFRQHTNILDL
jgi:hypothetical protein